MTVTIKNKTPLFTVPDPVRRQAGFKHGDEVEFKVSGGIINIVPKLPSADDEYTPEQRSVIDARLAEGLAEGLADIKAGRVSGPFLTHKEFTTSLHKTTTKATRKQT
jgi:bifunctional DNA-binding transcriptional regulator/antitoxin component of YhaV-PrlF toxin-antitoxin module